MLSHVFRSEDTILQSQLSPAMWVLGIEFRLSGLVVNTLTPSHLWSFNVYFFVYVRICTHVMVQLGIELRLPGLHGKRLHSLSHLNCLLLPS